jgi:hypothetical protein
MASNFRVPTLSTAGEEYKTFLGLKDTLTGAAGSHGIYFLYDRLANGVNWFCVVDDDSGTTSTDSGVVCTAGQFDDFQIIMNDAYDEVKFYINGSLVATETTNFPDSGTDYGHLQNVIVKSAGTTSRDTNVDFLYLAVKRA